MRIALVSPYDYPYPGGVTEHIAALDRVFRQWGHDVWVLATSSSDEEELHSNVLKVAGGVFGLPSSGSVARVSLSPRAYRRVKSILREMDFDVVHLHEPLMPVLPLAVLRHSHTLNVGTFHAYREISHPGYEYGRHLLQPFFDRLDGRIAVSEAARDAVSRYFPGDYTIIPNGIDYELYSREVEPLPEYCDGRPTILFMGRLEKRKGFEYLLQAFARVRRRIPHARLLVAGAYSKEDKEPYVLQARREGIRGVRFLGFVPTEDKPRCFRSCDVFCAPSVGFESFGIVLLEAMATGRPVVASSIPGYRTVLTHGREGLLVEPGDPESLAEALVRLLEDPDLRQRMGACGQESARNLAWDRVARRVMDYYLELMLGRVIPGNGH
ncbi:MAG: glycosyltransferase family 4 protein [Anaerolineae bacterium]|nr:glycosyltransferase family 4 protein [Anaerolineae bacterium]